MDEINKPLLPDEVVWLNTVTSIMNNPRSIDTFQAGQVYSVADNVVKQFRERFRQDEVPC